MITYEDVNKGIAEAMEYLYSIEHVWDEHRTLKLHDVFYYLEDLISEFPMVEREYKADDLFYMFCECEYDSFEDWLAQEGITDQRRYIGRTSSFYLTDIHDRDREVILNNLIDCVYGYASYCEFDSKSEMIPMSCSGYTELELLEDAQMEMEYFANGSFLADVKEWFKDAIAEADYIDNFLDNQVDYFKVFLLCINNEIIDEENAERRIETETMACYI